MRHSFMVILSGIGTCVALLLFLGFHGGAATAESDHESSAILPSLGNLAAGQSAPPFGGIFIDGTTTSLSRILARKPNLVVLSFFTTTCLFCKTGLIKLAAVREEWEKKGVLVYGVDVKEKPDAVKSYLRAEGIELPVIVDRYAPIAKLYQVVNESGEGEFPKTFVIDREGTIRMIVGKEGKDFPLVLLNALPSTN